MLQVIVDQGRTVLARLRSDGLRFVLGRIGNVIRHKIAPPWEILFCLPVSAAAPAGLDERGLQLAVVTRLPELTPIERDALSRSLGPRTVPVVERRLGLGAELHVLRCGDDVAGTWFAVLGRSTPFQHIPLMERDVMILDLRIDPRFRGRGFAAPLLQASARHLQERGFERIFATVSVGNLPSIRAFERAGFQSLLRMQRRFGRYRFDRDHLR